jgi:hypothetical protein
MNKFAIAIPLISEKHISKVLTLDFDISTLSDLGDWTFPLETSVFCFVGCIEDQSPISSHYFLED